ncbi:hydrogenase expression/formation protein HypE [bacterium]|nr:hydrogenase expression/formation protein HypE [bacterium]NIN92063.1 hydrogenase expression/formation protein HypE [bacterium]NIO18276.1 hydrogenase expression/formation protein HypE [bacterium]NIO73250.1 hydrogenase expression/formation protein HypE [bacterium]
MVKKFEDDAKRILLAHGSGGKLSHQLIKSFVKKFRNLPLAKLDDSAVLKFKGKLAFTTDSYVVDPIYFPGGDIGKLAVNGTVNDLAMVGARPLYLSASAIIEEGFSLNELEGIVDSMNRAARAAGVKIVAGDTKVVGKGGADKVFINTSGIGLVDSGVDISSKNARLGDKIILSGTIGDHGIAILNAREGFDFRTKVKSDCQPLNGMVSEILKVSKNVHVLRDPTRGGLATSLNEIAKQSGVGIEIEEEKIPVKEEVKAVCEMLGFDPLYIANEGKLVAFVPQKDCAKILNAIKKNKQGKDAQIIGAVVSRHKGRVVVKTSVGGERVLDMLTGEQLPRIC